MRKMKLAMLIVFCVMLFGGTVVSFVLPDREFSDVENRELAKKPKITAKRILSGEYQKEYDTYLSDQFFFRDKWVDLAVRVQIALGKKDFNGVYLGKNNYLLEKYEKADFDSGQIKENETYLTTFLNETEKRYGRKHVRAMFVPSKTTALTNVLPAYADTIDWQSTIRDLQTKVDAPNLIYDLTKRCSRIMRNIFTIGRIIIGQVLGLIMHIVHGHFKPDGKQKIYPISSAYLYLMIFMGLPIIRFMPVARRMWWKNLKAKIR